MVFIEALRHIRQDVVPSPQDLWEATLTFSYKWVEHFETRLEYRHDQSNVRSFDRDGKPTKSQDTLATEFIFRF